MSDLLPHDLVWGDDGHLAEEAVTALADGQDAILPADARDHAAACESCALSIGGAALMAHDVASAIQGALAAAEVVVPEVTPVRAPASAKPPSSRVASFPLTWVAAALAVAGIGAVPSLVHAPAFASTARFAVATGAPVFLRAVASLLKGQGDIQRLVLVMSAASALVLFFFGYLVARGRSFKALGKQGVSS